MAGFTDHCVVASRREVAEAGMQMLSRGGNAVDAAVAMAFVSGVVDPVDSTLAGSGFIIGYEGRTGGSWAVEFPPRAPLGAEPSMFRTVADASDGERAIGISTVEGNANAVGALAAGTPAAIAGLCLAHTTRGSLDLETILEPATCCADDGFTVDAYFTLQAASHEDMLKRFPSTAQTFLPGGRLPVAQWSHPASGGSGPKIRQEPMARFLERIGRGGSAALYGGVLGDLVAEDVRASGGLINAGDLAAYEARNGPPLRRTVGDAEFLTATSPSGGWTVLALAYLWDILLEGGSGALARDDCAHLAIESSRHAFADRYRFHGDPDFGAVPVDELLAPTHLDRVAAAVARHDGELRFDVDSRPPWDHYADAVVHEWITGERLGPAPAPDPRESRAGRAGGTTHFCVVDRERAIVSCTMTAGEAFGSKLVLPGSGLLLDSGMLWFNAAPGFANSIIARKRPLANMSPMIVACRDGSVLAIGAAGGRRIISAVAQVARSFLESRLSLQEAIDAPRFDPSGSTVLLSSRVDASIGDGLSARGHTIRLVDERLSPYQYEFARPAAVAIDSAGRIHGAIHSTMPGYVLGE